MRHRPHRAIGSLILGAAACGGETNGETARAAPVDTGLPQSAAVEDLSAADQDQLCDAILESVVDTLLDPEALDGFCRLAGNLAATFAGSLPAAMDACTDAYEACLDEASVRAELTDECHVPPSCEATVGDVEACVRGQLDLTLRLFDDLRSCSELTEDDVNGDRLASPGELPRACQRVEEACPAWDVGRGTASPSFD